VYIVWCLYMNHTDTKYTNDFTYDLFLLIKYQREVLFWRLPRDLSPWVRSGSLTYRRGRASLSRVFVALWSRFFLVFALKCTQMILVQPLQPIFPTEERIKVYEYGNCIKEQNIGNILTHAIIKIPSLTHVSLMPSKYFFL